MASARSVSTLALLPALLAGCRSRTPAPVDTELASCVPAGTQALAGIRLDQLRASPVLQKLAAPWLALLYPAHDAATLWVAYNGKDLLWVARGDFHAAPDGATLLSPNLVVAGPASLVRAASAQHASGKTGAPALVAQAELLARQPIWAVADGGVVLPLSGNAANLNRLLGMAEYTRLSLDANSGLTLHAAAQCRSAAQARQLEETARGLLSLARASVREPDRASLFASIQIQRDNLAIRADSPVPPQALDQLMGAAAAR